MRIQVTELDDTLINPDSNGVNESPGPSEVRAGVTIANTPASKAPDPKKESTPDTNYLRDHFMDAIRSFYSTVDRIKTDNPVDMVTFLALSGKNQSAQLTPEEIILYDQLKLAAQRQGRAMGAVIGFFLKFKPYPMLAEVRAREGIFQPAFGPVLVADDISVRDVLSRHDEFTVDPYGVQMGKAMSPEHNGGFDAFILGTDNEEKYCEDKRLLSAVVSSKDTVFITDLVYGECQRQMQKALHQARLSGSKSIDVVPTVARFIPVFLAHHYLGVPSSEQSGHFDLDDHMLSLYGNKVSGPDGVTPIPATYEEPDGTVIELPDSELRREDGIIPDQQQVYDWIVACFRHFFNNVQKDVKVQAYGVRAYRELLVYLLREIHIQKKALQAGKDAVADNMLTRLIKIQMGMPLNATDDPVVVDSSRVSDVRIAENVMGTIVGAVAGQEEATCRVIDSVIRLKEGEYTQAPGTTPPAGLHYGSFEKACELANRIKNNHDVANSRAELLKYVFEALRLQPQGEILLRQCAKDGAIIGNSRPLRSGTLVFAAHGSAMRDIEQPDAFILGRPNSNYLHFGYGRHKCLGQYVAPILMREALATVLQLDNIRRPLPRPNEVAFPRERRYGHFQLDDDNLYAKTFSLEYDD